ncbi:UNVERIFIED_CONTAM: response regulator [Comamonas sp. A-3]|nr:response regulator [Comamonas thiooxydans]
MKTPPPVVVLVEDDPLITRFVAIALEDLSLDLVTCTTAEEAQKLIPLSSCALLITDMMLPGASGLQLIEWLRKSSFSACPVVVFSAGLDCSITEHLEQLSVRRVLRKPVSVKELVTCIATALNANVAPSVMHAARTSNVRDMHVEEYAINTYFCGDRELFIEYKAACAVQMSTDLTLGAQHLSSSDSEGLHRLAHNLKSVFRLLGLETASDTARTLEEACKGADWEKVLAHWHLIRMEMQRLAAWEKPV